MQDSTELQEGPVQPCASISPPDDLLDSLIEGFQVIDFDFRYLYVNAAVVEHGKTTREALLGRTMQEAYPGIDQTEMFGVLRDCMQRRVRRSMENEFRYPDGSTGWFELRFRPVAEGVAILSLDITERKRSELALRRALHALETLCHCNLTLADARDEGGFVRDICNLMVEAGEQPAAWIRLDSVDSADGSAPDGGSTVRAERTERAAGTPVADLPQETRPILAGGKVIGELGVVARRREGLNADEHRLVDEVARNLGYGLENLRARVTHVRTQQQLEGAQRLEAVGRLAGGVAHDFNNLLSVILAYAGFIAEQVGSEPKIVEDVEQVQLAAERAAALTRPLHR
ncbi:MAG: PAS domain-containing protein [Myxococcales bacterium]